MRFKTTWILMAALIVIAAFFFLVEERQRVEGERKSKEARKLLPYGPEEVERFILINPDGVRFEIERYGGSWLIKRPTTTEGSVTTIDLVLGQTVPGRRLDEIADVSAPADFGLEKPFATIILFAGNRSGPDTVYIGDETPAGRGCYVRLGSSPDVIVVRETTRKAVNKNLYHLRDKNFVHLRSGSIDAVTIAKGANKVTIERKRDRWWHKEPAFIVNGEKLEGYLNELTKAIIMDFASENTENLERYGLDNPAETITLQMGTESTEIAFGNRKDNLVYTRRNGLDKVLLLDERILDIFEWIDGDIRAMNLTFFRPIDVKMMRYETPDTSVVFETAGKGWRTAGPDSLAVSSHEVIALLRILAEVKFLEIVEEPLPPGDERLESYTLRITLMDMTGGTLDTVTFVPAPQGYELGASMTANALGRLEKETSWELRRIFNRIGMPPAPVRSP